jgi:flagellar motility protein MotE (MotC chaperone)
VISPERTYAVVVGIEQYEAGRKWDLDGSAESALRIIGWLRECHVPFENITVLLSPLDSNRSRVEQRLADLGFPTESLPATVEKVRQVVTEHLPGKDGDLLVLFWSGHGVLDGRLQRRLFCADAGINAKYNINVTDLLAALSGKNFRGLRDQVVIVDACANFIQEMRLNLQAPESGFALGATRSVSRDALLAATEGESALLDRKASFGNVVADWFEEHGHTLPPSMDQLAADVVKRFGQLRAADITAQHPVRIREILHGNENEREHVFGGDPVQNPAAPDDQALAGEIAAKAPLDAADELARIPSDRAAHILTLMNPTTVSTLLANLDDRAAYAILTYLESDALIEILDTLGPYGGKVRILELVKPRLAATAFSKMREMQGFVIRQMEPRPAGAIVDEMTRSELEKAHYFGSTQPPDPLDRPMDYITIERGLYLMSMIRVDRAAELLGNMVQRNPERADEYLRKMKPRLAGSIFNAMDIDTAQGWIARMDAAAATRLLETMPPKKASIVRKSIEGPYED